MKIINFLDLINKIRSLHFEDLVKLYKKILFIIVAIIVTIIAIKTISSGTLLNTNNEDNIATEEGEELIYKDNSDSLVYTTKKMDPVVKEEHKNDFDEFNKITFSNFNIEDDILTVDATNNTGQVIRGLSIVAIDSNNNEVTTINSNADSKIKSGETVTLEGLCFTNNAIIGTYSYLTSSNNVTIDLANKFALTTDNNLIHEDD